MSAPGEAPVLLSRHGSLGRITLNRPRAINALSRPMVDAIDAALHDWADDPAVRVVMIDGAGERGLCAGGDIRALHAAVTAGDPEDAVAFMAHEYRMNAHIGAFAKPYVAFMDGVVMGGGIGVSSHGSVRLVTERATLAMPETSIGLFPDVGGTWLLGRRAPGELGTHLALTGRRIGAADAILAGLADRCVPADCREALAAALADCTDMGSVHAVVDRFAIDPPAPDGGGLAGSRDWIDRAYAGHSVADILAALDAEAGPDAAKAAAEIRRNSPTSLAVTLRALRLARGSGGLDECLAREFGIVRHSLASADFCEGVRAAVIDKDGRPSWRPARLDALDPAAIEAFFAPPDRTLGLGIAEADRTKGPAS